MKNHSCSCQVVGVLLFVQGFQFQTNDIAADIIAHISPKYKAVGLYILVVC